MSDPLAREAVTCEAGCGACAPCVAQLSSAQERLAALRAVLAREREPLAAVTHLLRLCRDENSVLWERANEPQCRDRVAAAARMLEGQSGGPVLGAEVRGLLAAALEPVDDVPAVVVARALAGFIDDRYGGASPRRFAVVALTSRRSATRCPWTAPTCGP